MAAEDEVATAAEQKKFAPPEFDVILPDSMPNRIYWLFFDDQHPAPPRKEGRGQLTIPASGSLVVGNIHLDTSMENHGVYHPGSQDGKPVVISTLDGNFIYGGHQVRYVEVFSGNSYEFQKVSNAAEPWIAAYAKFSQPSGTPNPQ